jgi:hypothetical protein
VRGAAAAGGNAARPGLEDEAAPPRAPSCAGRGNAALAEAAPDVGLPLAGVDDCDAVLAAAAPVGEMDVLAGMGELEFVGQGGIKPIIRLSTPQAASHEDPPCAAFLGGGKRSEDELGARRHRRAARRRHCAPVSPAFAAQARSAW